MKKQAINYGVPRFQPSAVKHVIPPKQQIVHQWQFPLGGKMASLTISGWPDVTTEDMAALIEVATMLRTQIDRANKPTEPDYSI